MAWRERWPNKKSRYDSDEDEKPPPTEDPIKPEEPAFYRTTPKDPKYDPDLDYIGKDHRFGHWTKPELDAWMLTGKVPDEQLQWEPGLKKEDYPLEWVEDETEIGHWVHPWDVPEEPVETKPTAEIIENPPQPQGLPAPVIDKPKEVPHLSQFGNFLLKEHLDEFQNLIEGQVSEEELRQQYPVGSAGQFVMGGDDELEERLGLPDEIRAVEIGNTVLKQFDPYQVKLPQLGGSIYNSFHTIIS